MAPGLPLSVARRVLTNMPDETEEPPSQHATKTLNRRAEEATTTTVDPGQGSIDPESINMQVILAVFAFLAAVFVLAAIWFFFWAKNGGFVWRKNDWEDYKSTVLRRKGPDGKTLSNATKSTNLGGGSVVAGGSEKYTDYDRDDVTGTMTGDGQTYATTEAGTSEKKAKRKMAGFRDKLRRKKKSEKWEGEHDDDVRAYRHEKPARVGGLNRHPDGTYHDGSTEPTNSNPQMSEYNQSDLSSGAGRRYDDYPEHGYDRGQQRNVSGYSFTPGQEDTISNVTEEHPLREEPAPARRSHRQHRHSHRPRGPRPNSRPSSSRKHDRTSMPGGYASPLDMSSVGGSDYQYQQVNESEGTRSYHHPIPALTKGYRRGAGGRGKRRDSLSDSEGEV